MDGRTGEIPNDGIASTPPSRTMVVEEKQQAENNIMDVTIVILKNVLLLSSSRDARSYADGCKRIIEYLHNYSGRGVTGSIALSGRPSAVPAVPVGQNVGSTILRLAVYQRDGEWIITNTGAL